GSTLSQPAAEARYFLQQRRSFPPFGQGGHRETSQEVTRGAASARAHGCFWDGTELIRDRERALHVVPFPYAAEFKLDERTTSCAGWAPWMVTRLKASRSS